MREVKRTELEERILNELLEASLTQRRHGAADWSKLRHLRFEEFQESKAFKDHPCDFEFYDSLVTELSKNDLLMGIAIDDYYEWYWKSASHLDQEGNPNTKIQVEFAEHVQYFLGKKPNDEILDHFYRNFDIHPVHREKFQIADVITIETENA